MRSLQRRFKIISQKHPFWSSLVCFERAIVGRNFKRRTLYYWFFQLVDRNDYRRKDSKDILDGLENKKPP